MNEVSAPLCPPATPPRWFYGWVLVGLCAATMLMSSPGQTTGVSTFIESLLAASGMDRAAISTAYLIGTLASGFSLTVAGRWVDRWGARALLVTACLLLAAILAALSHIDVAAHVWAQWLDVKAPIAFAILLGAGFAVLRFAGQGLMVICCQTTLGHWFDRRRGAATAINGAVLALASNATPLIFLTIIHHLGWSRAWLVTALVAGLAWAVVAGLFWRNTPESCGLYPDGLPPDPHRAAHTRDAVAWTRDEALRTRAFWTVAGCVSLLGLVITAETFHLADIGAEAGLGPTVAHGFLLVIGATALPVGLCAGFLADRIRPKWLCVILASAMTLHLLTMPMLGDGWRYLLPGIPLGIAAGTAGTVSVTIHPRYFGRRHLGAINGVQWAAAVIASAIGPVGYALAHDHLGGYASGMSLCLIPTLLVLFSAMTMRQPQKPVTG